jgi:hypothetical protein
MKRRHFLQTATAAAGAIGLSQFTLERGALRYARALAQSHPRKLALLVGVNNYAAPGVDTLFGAVNDVELQQQLLIHRFGFHPNDIQTLTNENATRENILAVYEEHLVNQAAPGDVVVFHFSGHGEMVEELDVCDEDDCQNGAIVPYDSALNTQDGTVDSIMGHSRFLMDAKMAQKGVENITVVLDCCYSGGGKRGNVVMRSRVTDQTIRTGQLPRVSPTEQTFQQVWLDRLGWDEEAFIRQRQTKVAGGVVITSARRDQKSADYPFDGFYAGAFTYLLTQYLWQLSTDQNVGQVVRYVSRSARSLSEHSQIPEFEPIEGEIVDDFPIYQSSSQIPPAEAVVTEVLGNSRVEMWLGGLDTQTLTGFGEGSEFALLDKATKAVKGTVVLDRARTELIAEGRFIPAGASSPTVGDVLQEVFRTIPQPVTLKVGIEPSLNLPIEQVDQLLRARATFLEVYPVQSGAHVHCTIGRLTSGVQQRLLEVPNLPATNSVGLFKATGEPIPGSFDRPEEALETAIDRLQPVFKSLLIGRMLRLLLNGRTSRLKIQLSLQVERGRGVPILATTPRSRSDEAILLPELQGNGIEEISIGARLRIQVDNQESQRLYVSLVTINAYGEVDILFPYNWEDPVSQSEITAEGRLEFPRIKAVGPIGLSELLVIASTQPLTTALRAINRLIPPQNRSQGAITEPDEVMTALFSDLDTRRSEGSSSVTETSQIDTSQVAVVSLLYRVVETAQG